MKIEKRIAMKNLPMRFPIWQIITAWLLLYHLNAPGYAYGITFTILGIVFLAAIIDRIYCTDVDVLSGGR